MRKTVQANQGSQPSFGGTRVGVVRAAARDGVGRVQLLVRASQDERTVIATQGDVLPLPGGGTLTIGPVLAEPGSTRGTVTLEFDDAEGDR
ncbi:hypothetical protein AAG589_06300 [Isoptericola sp. F-RaC21]|uniref:hypothetical protein n=1 Tax=Isoptericola sp. F-RaC21 TaxID=3141452 RepID=UPI00315B7CDF